MDRPIIGVSARPYITDNGRNALVILESIRRAIINNGGIPHIILPTQDMVYMNNRETPLTDTDKEILDAQIDMCDGILMPGGDFMYFYDRYICDRANEKDMPLLGICMGMQTMCNYNNENKNIFIEGHKDLTKDYVHSVNIIPGTKLYDIIGETKIMVNSIHRTKVPNSGDYSVCAKAEGDIIEGIEKKDKLFNIGVQWHPERTNDEPSRKIITAFIEACKQYKENNK